MGHNKLTLRDLKPGGPIGALLSLKRFHLKHNRIPTIPSYLFEIAPKLIELDLADNLLHEVREGETA